MISRIFDIVTFPIYFIYLLLSFPFKIVKIIVYDKIEKRNYNNRKLSVKKNDKEIIAIGAILFPKLEMEFEVFFKTFMNDKKRFLSENEQLLQSYENFKLDKLKLLEVIYIFGDSNGKLLLTDWRGEENEREIENFLEDKLQIKTDWKNINKIRKGINLEKQRDGKFIIDLLKAIEKDFKPLNKKLIFLDIGWDAYVYTAIDQVSYKIITDKFGAYFHGIEKL